jgi:hypothetical protein
VLATAEIVLDVAIFENVGIHLVSLYKEGDVEVGVNEGYLELVNFSDTDFSTKLGKMYLPFGKLETNLVNDTLALGLVSPFESLGFRESAALLSWSAGNMGLAGYVFNGDDDGDDKLDDWGVSFSFESDQLNLGLDYLSNVSDSAMISDALMDIHSIDPTDDLPSFAFRARVDLGNATLLIEHIQTDDLDEIGFLSSDSPSVSQIDLGYDLGNNWGIAGAYQVTDDGAVLGMPESRTTLGVATSVARGMVSISFEYWRDEDYEMSDGGTDKDLNGFVVQLAAEF